MKKILCAVLWIAIALTCLTACGGVGGKKTPKFETPSITAKYGQTLADLALPSGFTWQEPLSTSVGEVGVHVFHVTFSPSDLSKYETVSDVEVTVTVGKGAAEPEAVAMLSAVYGQTLRDLELPEGFTWQESVSTSVGNAGDNVFHVIYTPEDTANYEVVRDIAVTVFVAKANYDMSNVILPSAAFVYDGRAKSLFIEEGTLPEGVTVTYEGNGKTEVGKYQVVAHFAGDAANYNAIADINANLIIVPGEIEGVSFEDATFVYDGTNKSLAVVGADDSMTVRYDTSNAATDAGSYEIKATISKPSYRDLELTATLTIEKATYDMTGVTFQNKSVAYNGEKQSILISGELPAGVSVEYENNELTEVGETVASAIFSGDEKNYNAIPRLTAKLTIYLAE